MPVKIRLARRGRRKKPYYHIIVADSRSPRDGRFIEQIGSYNPMTKPATIDLDRDKALEWLEKGAQPTDTARAILRFKGVMYRRHLLRGVKKGALTQEDADKLYNDYVESKESKVAERFEEARKEKEAFWLAVSGSTKQKAPDLTRDEEAVSAFQEVSEETPETASEASEDAAAATPTVEDVAEAIAPEAVEQAGQDDVPAAKTESETDQAEEEAEVTVAPEAESTPDESEEVASAEEPAKEDVPEEQVESTQEEE